MDKICLLSNFCARVSGEKQNYNFVSLGSAPQHKITHRSKISELINGLSVICTLECVVGELREATNQPVYSVFILKYYSITRTPNFFESTDTVQDGAAASEQNVSAMTGITC